VQPYNAALVVLGQPELCPVPPAAAFFLALVGLVMAIYLISVRRFTGSQFENSTETSMTLSKGEGIVNIPTNHSVDQTVEKLALNQNLENYAYYAAF
jgi:hypothetical protein